MAEESGGPSCHSGATCGVGVGPRVLQVVPRTWIPASLSLILWLQLLPDLLSIPTSNMSPSGFGHIDLRLRNLAADIPLYSALMPALGFTTERQGAGWHTFARTEAQPGQQFLPICEDPEHVPNANRIAFCVESREEVEHVAAIVRDAGAAIESGPRDCPEYWPTYYAVFFEDNCGNKLEVYHLLD